MPCRATLSAVLRFPSHGKRHGEGVKRENDTEDGFRFICDLFVAVFHGTENAKEGSIRNGKRHGVFDPGRNGAQGRIRQV